jgi:hypothetical protein
VQQDADVNQITRDAAVGEWGSPAQLRFLRHMMDATPDGQVFPVRKELILWMLDRIAATAGEK